MTTDDARPRPAPVARVVESYGGSPCTYVRPSRAPVRPGEVCGEIHDRCRGHYGRHPDPETGEPSPRWGDPCLGPPIVGACKCRHHLRGKVERAEAQRAAVLQRARGPLGRILGVTEAHARQLGPTEALEAMQARAVGMATALGVLLGDLEERAGADVTHHEVASGMRVRVEVHAEGLVGPNSAGETKVHALLPEYREWVKLAMTAAKLGVDANLAERRQALDEAQTSVLLEVLRKVLADNGVEWTPEVARAVAAEFRQHPQAIEATAVESVMVDPDDLAWADDDPDDWLIDEDEGVEEDLAADPALAFHEPTNAQVTAPAAVEGSAPVDDEVFHAPPASSWLDAYGGPT